MPRTLGRYTLLKPIGEGGTAQAYLAAFGDPPRACVLKLQRDDGDSAAMARFDAEARLMARISCPNIVSVIEAGRDKGRRFIAMELIEGRDLREVIRRARKRGLPFPVPAAVFIVREIVRGLHYLHSHDELRVVHRDVSPANVMVAFNGEVKLIDFGLARPSAADTGTLPGMADGHFGYLAPERLAGRRHDQRADLFSAGMILWELLTGREWFATPEDSRGVMTGLPPERSEPIPLASSERAGIDTRLDLIVEKSLSQEPVDRYGNAEAMRIDLASYLGTIDAAADWGTVQAFIRPLFEDEIGPGRRERSRLLSTVAVGRVTASATVAGTPGHSSGQADVRRNKAAMWLAVGAATAFVAAIALRVAMARHNQPEKEPARAASIPIMRLLPTSPASTATVPTVAAASPPELTLPPVEHAPAPHSRAVKAIPPVLLAPRAEDPVPKMPASPPSTPSERRRDLVGDARAALERRDFESAVDLGKRALRAGGDDLHAHLVLAATYYLLTRYAESRQHYDAASQLDPGNPEAVRGLAMAKVREQQ